MSAPPEQRVLVGVDGSDPSKEALRVGARLAAALDAPLEAVACAGDPTVFDVDLLVDERRLEEQYRRVLDTTIAEVFGEDVPSFLTATVTRGRPAGRLIAESEDAQLLVLGRRGRGGLFGMSSLGSVSNACVAYAHCPVLVVRR